MWSRRRLSAVCSGGGPARTVRAPDRWLTPKSASGAGAPLPQGTGPAGCRPPGRGPSRRRRGRGRALGPGARPRPPRPEVRAGEGARSVLPALDPVPDGPLLPRAPLHDQPQPEARVLGQLHLQAPAGVPAHDGAALWGREMGSAPGPSQGHPGIEGCSPMWSLMAACDSGPRLSPLTLLPGPPAHSSALCLSSGLGVRAQQPPQGLGADTAEPGALACTPRLEPAGWPSSLPVPGARQAQAAGGRL